MNWHKVCEEVSTALTGGGGDHTSDHSVGSAKTAIAHC